MVRCRFGAGAGLAGLMIGFLMSVTSVFAQSPLQPQAVPQAVPQVTQAEQEIPSVHHLTTGSGPGAEVVGMFRAELIPHVDGRRALVQIVAELADGCHLYSLTEAEERRTRVELSQSPSLAVAGAVQPSHAPDAIVELAGEPPVHQYAGKVAFYIPLEVLTLPPNGDHNLLVRINGLVCSVSGFCLPVRDAVIRVTAAQPVNEFPVVLQDGTVGERVAEALPVDQAPAASALPGNSDLSGNMGQENPAAGLPATGNGQSASGQSSRRRE